MTTLKQFVAVALATTLTIATQAQTSTTSGAKPTTKTTTTVKATPANTTTTTKPGTAKTTTTVKKTATKTTTTVKKATTTTPAKTSSQSSSAATTTTTGKTPQTIDNTNSGKTIKTGTLVRPADTPNSNQPVNTSTGTPNSNNASPWGNTNQGTQTNTNNNSSPWGQGTQPNTNNNQGNNIINNITDGEATSAIKEALMKGIQVGVDKVSVTDGFFKNSMIKILFPNEVRQVESTLRSVGMGSLADNMIMSMNRAAEQASKQAGPIFINSIKQMNVTDAVSIVSNQQPDAATQFLKRTTTESLVASFKPTIKTALDQTLATKYWAEITSYYNRIPLVSPVNTDLPDYVTRKAIDGLFLMVAQEEAKIRKDPIGTGSDIIDKVFGSVRKR